MARIQFAALVILLAGIPISTTAANTKRMLSKTPLSTEQMEIYSAFLSFYTNGSKSSRLNLANRTGPLDLAEQRGPNGCLKAIDFDESEHPDSAFHKFDAQTVLPKNIVLVDPDRQSTTIKENDPDRTMRQGTPVNDAVDAAFASGLLTLSEITFDKTHRYAVMSFSFVCGGLCGHGETIVFQKVDGKWKRTERRCGGWVS
jgi:hypothetical protein